MREPMTATELRAKIYRVLDEVLDSGEPQEVVRRGAHLLIMPLGSPGRRLDRLPKRDVLACSVDELIETSFDDAWEPDGE